MDLAAVLASLLGRNNSSAPSNPSAPVSNQGARYDYQPPVFQRPMPTKMNLTVPQQSIYTPLTPPGVDHSQLQLMGGNGQMWYEHPDGTRYPVGRMPSPLLPVRGGFPSFPRLI